jgi:hypothetical protein
MNATPSEIHQWKSTMSVQNCNNILFQSISVGDVAYITRIIDRVWPDQNKQTDIQMAYAVSICQILLNPNNDNIKISKSTIKQRLRENLVSFAILCK